MIIIESINIYTIMKTYNYKQIKLLRGEFSTYYDNLIFINFFNKLPIINKI